MEIEVLTICDNAQDYQGKLVVVGTFTTIISNQIPFNQPSFALACRFRFSPDEAGEKKFSFSFKRSNGQEFLPGMEASINVPENLTEDHPANLILGFNNLSFDEVGSYILEVKSDSFNRKIPLYIKKL